MARDSFIFYKSFYEAISDLDDKVQRLELYEAICKNSLYDEDTELNGLSGTLYKLIKPQLEANNERYRNGNKGGRPKKETNGYEIEKTIGFENKKPNKNENVNVNDNENVNVNNKVQKIHFAEFVSMTNAEYEKLISTYGKDFADQCIQVLDNYKGANGKKYKSDYRAIQNWVIDKVKEVRSKNQGKYNNSNKREYNNFDNIYAN